MAATIEAMCGEGEALFRDDPAAPENRRHARNLLLGWSVAAVSSMFSHRRDRAARGSGLRLKVELR